MYTMLFLGLASLPMALLIAALVWRAGGSALLQAAIILVGFLWGVLSGTLCLGAAKGELRP